MVGGSEAAIYAAIAQAVKASGVIVHIQPEDFLKILTRTKEPLVVAARGGTIKKNFQYLTGYKGLAFFTKASEPLMLPGGAEVVSAKQIWIPA